MGKSAIGSSDAVSMAPNCKAHARPGRGAPSRIFLALFLLYLLLPMVLVLIGAFGRSWTNTLLPSGITLDGFRALLDDTSFRRAFNVSLIVALSCCVVTALIGVPLAYALHHGAQAGHRLVSLLVRMISLLPIGVPALTLGFGYVAVFSDDPMPWIGSLPLLVAAHVVLTLPYLTQTLLGDLRHLGIETLETCAATLGATPWRQFTSVTLPCLRHSIVSGLVMVAALSIGEFQISNLIAGFRYRNYPVVLLQAFYGATGLACAATVVLLCLAVAATLLSTVAAGRERAANRVDQVNDEAPGALHDAGSGAVR
ncbi:putative spermidine/putrescine transport system permease protein [Robbsia andropogonis]